VVPALDEHPSVLRQMEAAMTELGIGHVTIQLETGEACGAEQCGHEDHGVAPAAGAAPHRH
jgi:hypothetical protein